MISTHKLHIVSSTTSGRMSIRFVSNFYFNDYMHGPNTKFGDSLDFHISSCIDPM